MAKVYRIQTFKIRNIRKRSPIQKAFGDGIRTFFNLPPWVTLPLIDPASSSKPIQREHCSWGQTGTSLLNKPFSDFISPESENVFELHSRRIFSDRTKQSCDLKLSNHHDSPIWVQLESLAFQSGRGDSEQFLSVAKEITNRKAAEEALRKTHDELEQRVARAYRRTGEYQPKIAPPNIRVRVCRSSPQGIGTKIQHPGRRRLDWRLYY